jgi:hypothetical protein
MMDDMRNIYRCFMKMDMAISKYKYKDSDLIVSTILYWTINCFCIALREFIKNNPHWKKRYINRKLRKLGGVDISHFTKQ